MEGRQAQRGPSIERRALDRDRARATSSESSARNGTRDRLRALTRCDRCSSCRGIAFAAHPLRRLDRRASSTARRCCCGPRGRRLVTSAGLDRDTVTSVARSYDGETSAEAAALAPSDLQAISPLPSSDRHATWSAKYGSSDPTEKDGEPWVKIHVELSGTPWAARASIYPIPADGLSVPTRSGTALRTGDNGGFRYATWSTETGARIQLMANLPEAEVRELADRLELVGPDDPRLDRFEDVVPGEARRCATCGATFRTSPSTFDDG